DEETRDGSDRGADPSVDDGEEQIHDRKDEESPGPVARLVDADAHVEEVEPDDEPERAASQDRDQGSSALAEIGGLLRRLAFLGLESGVVRPGAREAPRGVGRRELPAARANDHAHSGELELHELDLDPPVVDERPEARLVALPDLEL